MADGIFTQHGPDGIFGRGGPPADPAAPTVDSDGTPLRMTMVTTWPSPGHMRVARAIRYPASHKVEFQEEYRTPTPEEVEYLARQGVCKVGPGGMITPGPAAGLGDATSDAAPAANGAPTASASAGFPWLKCGLALAAGIVGTIVTTKYVIPKVFGESDGESDGDEPDDAGDDGDDGDVD